MKIENQVVNLGLARQLKKLGVKQESLWYWNRYITAKAYLSQSKQYEDKFFSDGTYIQYSVSAFTVAELGEVLPDSINIDSKKYYLFLTKTKKTKYFKLPDYYISYKSPNDKFLHSEREDKEADARAKMVIYLLKNNLLSIL